MGCGSSSPMPVQPLPSPPQTQDINITQNVDFKRSDPSPNPTPPSVPAPRETPAPGPPPAADTTLVHKPAPTVVPASRPRPSPTPEAIITPAPVVRNPSPVITPAPKPVKKEYTTQEKHGLLDKMRFALARGHAELEQAQKRAKQDVRKAVSEKKSVQIINMHLTCVLRISQQIERNELLDAKVKTAKTDRLIFEDNFDMATLMESLTDDMKTVSATYDTATIQKNAAGLAEAENRRIVDESVAGRAINDALDPLQNDVTDDKLAELLKEIMG